jgi:hypothetical protein
MSKVSGVGSFVGRSERVDFVFDDREGLAIRDMSSELGNWLGTATDIAFDGDTGDGCNLHIPILVWDGPGCNLRAFMPSDWRKSFTIATMDAV